jgi:hypothetical protein
MVSIDDMPALFVSFDSKSPRPRSSSLCLASSFPRPHLFLLRVFGEEIFLVRMFLKSFEAFPARENEKSERKRQHKKEIVVRKSFSSF